MTKLDTQTSCEIDDLIMAIAEHTGKNYNEVESAAFDVGKYPESTKTFIWNRPEHFDDNDKHWFMIACYEIMEQNNIGDSLYVTHAI